MNAIEWMVVFILVAVVLVGGNVARDWQNERHDNSQQEQLDLFQGGIELFPTTGVLHQEIPERIKKEECEASRECYKLAEALVYESRSESYMGALAVASVILNRKDHPNFPNTVRGVISQPYQFSYVGFEHLQQQPSERDWERAFIVAYDVKHGLVERLDGVYFYLNKQTLGHKLPRWAIEYTEVETIGMHTFYTW